MQLQQVVNEMLRHTGGERPRRPRDRPGDGVEGCLAPEALEPQPGPQAARQMIGERIELREVLLAEGQDDA